MPANTTDVDMSPVDRRQQVAAVLARGLARWRRRARAGGFAPAPEISPERETPRRVRLTWKREGHFRGLLDSNVPAD